jgi:hypothetical protein
LQVFVAATYAPSVRRRIEMKEQILMNALFYTFSTIAQTLAAAIALLAAFLLYRLQVLVSEIDDNFDRICRPLEFLQGYKVRNMNYAHDYYAVLKLADETQFPKDSFTAEDERTRLPILLNKKKSILNSFWFALYLTAGLIIFSIFVLIVTPQIANSSCLLWFVFVLGFLWFASCITSYLVFLKKAFQ